MFYIKKVAILIAVLVAVVFFTSQTPPANNLNGFFADPGSFEILSSYKGRNNVLKVNKSKTQWNIARYSLAQYRGKEILIEFSADVRCEGSVVSLAWQVNNPNYPTISMFGDAPLDKWHAMKGKMIITPTQNDAMIYLTNYQMSSNAIIYIANPIITITEDNPLTPDLSLRPLKEIYANDFLIGTITNYDGLYMSGKYFDLLKHHYNIVTFNAVYPHMVTPSIKGGVYQFANADNILNIAVRNNLYVYGQNLVYPGEEPAWMTEGTREEVIQNLNNHITTVVRQFSGRINIWEVVNEALKPNITNAEARGDWKRCLATTQNTSWRNHRWYDRLGADYIELAFRAARAADSNVTLYYNDFDLLALNKAEVVIKMIKDINDRYKRETGGARNLIEGLGVQVHIGSSQLSQDLNFNFNNARTALQRLTSLGIEIGITEVDISTSGYVRGEGRDSVMSDRNALNQALLYARLFSLFKEFSAHIKFVTFWGIDDGNSWLSEGNPLLFDWRLNAKPAFYAVSDPDGFLKQHGVSTRR